MLKILFWLFSFAVLTLSACGTLQVSIALTPDPTATQPQPLEATLTPPPTYTPTLPEAETPTPDPNPPTFSEVSFFDMTRIDPNCSRNYRRIFPGLIRQIYAEWNYANMRAGLTVRREWYLDGKLWLQREEAWDFAKYGAQGTISDISIYDLDAGLPPGDYELRLYINGQPQFNAQSKIGFQVDQTRLLEIPSPIGRLTAVITDPQKLMMREADGTAWELLSAHEISSLAWLPDGRHIVYSDADRSNTQGCSSIGIRYTSWIVDITNGTRRQLGSDDENIHQPMPSPGGHLLAVRTGSGWGDACMIDLGLVFIELDDNLREVRRFVPHDFAGIPPETPDGNMYPATDGTWLDDTQFDIGLNWTCRPDASPGRYTFNLSGMQAARTGDLPTP